MGDCNEQACPVDCVVGNWKLDLVNGCSKSCGTGAQKKTRTVLTAPLHGGKQCPTLNGVDDCNEQACPVDCVVGGWTGYSKCSKSCGTGIQKRTRTLTQPLHGG